jgi:hypothetical protein
MTLSDLWNANIHRIPFSWNIDIGKDLVWGSLTKLYLYDFLELDISSSKKS